MKQFIENAVGRAMLALIFVVPGRSKTLSHNYIIERNFFYETVKAIPKRAARIELASIAWKAMVLPLNYARKFPTI